MLYESMLSNDFRPALINKATLVNVPFPPGPCVASDGGNGGGGCVACAVSGSRAEAAPREASTRRPAGERETGPTSAEASPSSQWSTGSPGASGSGAALGSGPPA